MERRYLLTRALAILVLAATACGQAAEPTQQTGAAAPSTQGQSAKEAGQPVTGGELTYARDADADSLDPQYVTATEAGNSILQLYDTLVARDYDGVSYKPLLAKSWQVSDDGRTYTFTLRDDVTFHSGKKLTSADVKYTFERWQGKIQGKASPTQNYLDGVGDIETPDATTVVLKMERPNNFLLDNLSMPFASILNREAVEQAGDDYGSRVVDGTGPFKLVEWTRSDKMVLERNPDYAWGGEAFKNSGPAYLERLVFRTVPEASTRAVAIQRGEAQLARAQDMVPFLDQLKADSGLRVETYDVLNTRFAAFKTAKPKMADVRVRRALNMAIDRETIVDVIEKGLATPAFGFLHPATKYAWEQLDEVAYRYDPEAAKKLLDEAGWKVGADGIREKDGEKLSLDVYAGQQNEEELTLIQAQFREVGVQLNLKLVDRAALYEIRRTETPDLNYIYLPYDNAGILMSYFHSSQQPAPNRFNYADPETDSLLEKAQSSPNEQEVKEAYAEVQKRIHEAALAIPVLHRQNFVISSKKVQDFQPYPVYDMGIPKLVDAWIQP